MSREETLPSIDECIDLYRHIHRNFGDNKFQFTSLEASLKNSNINKYPSSKDKLLSQLHMAVAYGLLDSYGNNRYKVRVTPKESREIWQSKAVSRISNLYCQVHREENLSASEPERLSDEKTVYCDGDPFVIIQMDQGFNFQELLNDIDSIVERNPENEGIVLQAPGDLAGKVQQVTDRLCDNSTENQPVFEKVMTDLVGDEKDDLTFQVFLRKKS